MVIVCISWLNNLQEKILVISEGKPLQTSFKHVGPFIDFPKPGEG